MGIATVTLLVSLFYVEINATTIFPLNNCSKVFPIHATNIHKEPRSKQLFQKGIWGVTHATTLFNFIGILKSGTIFSERTKPDFNVVLPSGLVRDTSNWESEGNIAHNSIFFSPFVVNQRARVQAPVTLVLSGHLFDREDLFFNPGWNFGYPVFRFEEKRALMPDEFVEFSDFISTSDELVVAAGEGLRLKDYAVVALIAEDVWEQFLQLLLANGMAMESLPLPVRRKQQGVSSEEFSSRINQPPPITTTTWLQVLTHFRQLIEEESSKNKNYNLWTLDECVLELERNISDETEVRILDRIAKTFPQSVRSISGYLSLVSKLEAFKLRPGHATFTHAFNRMLVRLDEYAIEQLNLSLKTHGHLCSEILRRRNQARWSPGRRIDPEVIKFLTSCNTISNP